MAPIVASMELMTAAEAAAFLGVRTATLYAYVSRGWLRSVPHPHDRRRRRYRRSDLERIARRSSAHAGHAAAAASALEWGAPSLDTAISTITGAGPAYRGRLAVDLAAQGSTFEAVAELLWTGAMPRSRATWSSGNEAVLELPGILPSCAHPVDVLRIAAAIAAQEDAMRLDESDAARIDAARDAVITLARTLALLRGSHHAADGTVAQLLAAAFGLAPNQAQARALDAALIIVADHELNASTFAARVAASTGANLYACITAALATFSGPRHGGAADRCAAVVAEIAAGRPARAALTHRTRRSVLLAGFGHPLYPDGDPRFALLDRVARELATDHRLAPVDALIAAGAELGLGPPSLDLGLVLLARALALPDPAAATIFAIGRSAGWIAHALEQRAQGFMLRPRARYIGPTASPLTLAEAPSSDSTTEAQSH